MLKRAPRLNGTKLPMVIPHQLLPRDIDAVEGMVRAWLSDAARSTGEGEAVRAVVEGLQARELGEEEAAVKHAASLLLFKGGSTPWGLLGRAESDWRRAADEDPTLTPVSKIILGTLAVKNKRLVRRVRAFCAEHRQHTRAMSSLSPEKHTECNLTLDGTRRLPDGWWKDLQGEAPGHVGVDDNHV